MPEGEGPVLPPADAASDRHRNHFNLIRMLAASAVIVAHSWLLTSGPGTDPLRAWTGFELGQSAVVGFFAISGFFVTQSFDRRESDLSFVLARAARILPGLLAVSIVTAFVVGPIFTSLPLSRYFAQSSVWMYPVRLVSIATLIEAPLPPMFVHNAVPAPVNVSLWTLFFEAVCYAVLFFAGVAGLLRKRRFIWFVAGFLPLYIVGRYGRWESAHDLAALSLPFVVGILVYRYRADGILNGWAAALLALAATAAIAAGHPIEELWSVSIAYGVLWAGFASAPRLLAYNRLGDFSYGTYIYGAVVQQVLAAVVPGIGPLAMAVISLPIAILCGVASWHLVERPAFALREGIRRSAPARERPVRHAG